ncbi:hypothetical protein [Micromonospora sp. NPDC049799]|uniref:WD40/YVTN/BNR-like repeat-containing protein n=1 Tax=Micromonospora sp. NPDC049799 TaxID=3154741 RepID=UPI00340E5943
MRETDLDDVFTEFEARTAPTFRPPGVADAARRVRDRRRRRRGLLAGVAALLLAGPGGAYAMAGRDDAPTPPAPDPSASPDDRLVERTVAVPGVPGELRQLQFVDARHGWALFDTCDREDVGSTDCRRDLARTADGGVTWQRTALPAAADEPNLAGPPYLLPLDGRRITVVIGDRYLVSTDGGASFTDHPVSTPPEVIDLALATDSGYSLRCPQDQGVFSGPSCPRPRLVGIGGAPVPVQPPLNLRSESDKQLVEGGDGRLWVTAREGDRLTMAVTDDRAATWRTLPAVAGAARLLVSPDGLDAWLVGISDTSFSATDPNRLWKLVGDRWQEQPGLPDDTSTVAAANGGVLPVTSAYGGGGYWYDKRYVDEPALGGPVRADDESASVQVLPDDTIVVTGQTGTFLGTGSGVDRSWTRLS